MVDAGLYVLYTLDMFIQTVAPTSVKEEAPMTVKRRGATYMTVTELAAAVGVHRNTIIYWIEQEQIQAERSGLSPRSRFLIPLQEANRVIAELSAGDRNEGGS